MTTIYLAEHHDQILSLWRDQQASLLKILHLDYHCDMRGMLIDRTSHKAYRIWDIVNTAVDEGNFLTHAIIEGRVRSVRWVHDEPGGRRYDVGGVKYKSDLTSLPHRWLIAIGGKIGIPIDYTVIPYVDWNGLGENECLDIDWDFFASKSYAPDTIKDRVDLFLKKKFNIIPQQIYLCYSPDYSHPSRAEFHRFVKELAQRYNAQVIELKATPDTPIERPFYKKYMANTFLRLAKSIYYSTNLWLRKRGIY